MIEHRKLSTTLLAVVVTTVVHASTASAQDAAQPKRIALPNGARVELTEGSTYNYLPPDGTPLPKGPVVAGRFNGQAKFEVPEMGQFVMLQTAAGEVMLLKGNHNVRTLGDTVWVSVEPGGSAAIRGGAGVYTERQLAGDKRFARMIRGAPPEIRTEATGFSIVPAGSAPPAAPPAVSLADSIEKIARSKLGLSSAMLRIRLGDLNRTDVGKTEEYFLSNGSRIVLRPSSRLRFTEQVRETMIDRTSLDHKNDPDWIAALDGEAVIIVSTAAGWAIVETSAGRVELSPGTYAINSLLSERPLMITVESGSARISGLGPEAAKESVVVPAGGYGRVVVGQRPVLEASGVGFPKVGKE